MPQRYTDTWHQDEAAAERAWLDQWARAMQTPGYPWARPDWDPSADWVDHIAAVSHNPVIAEHVLTGAHGSACHS